MLLYHLGIGAGSRPGDNLDPAALRYTLDNDDLQVLPSFGVVAPTFHETDPPPLDLPGCDINLGQVVHGSQEIEVNAAAADVRLGDPAHAHLRCLGQGQGGRHLAGGTRGLGRGRPVVDGALVDLRARRRRLGWRPRDVRPRSSSPDREPDCDASYDVTPQQAMLYRLCGDRNPLHADPAFAEAAGFPAPILHGLCSYGIVLRTVTDELLGGDAGKVRAFTARFAGVVFPGETIRVRAWHGDEGILVSATIRR